MIWHALPWKSLRKTPTGLPIAIDLPSGDTSIDENAFSVSTPVKPTTCCCPLAMSQIPKQAWSFLVEIKVLPSGVKAIDRTPALPPLMRPILSGSCHTCLPDVVTHAMRLPLPSVNRDLPSADSASSTALLVCLKRIDPRRSKALSGNGSSSPTLAGLGRAVGGSTFGG
jgi:hypothetical protein